MSQPPGQPYQDQPHSGEPYAGQTGPTGSYPGQPGGGAEAGFPPPSPAYPPTSGGPQSGGYGGAYPAVGGQPSFGGQPPKKKSPVLKIVLIVLAGFLVLCVAGVAVTYFLAKDKVAGVVDAAKITVVEPATLGGRPKLTDPQFAGSAASLKESLGKEPGTTSTVGALYGDPSKKDLAMVAAASSPTLDPQKRLDNALNDVSSGGLALTDVVTVDPGPLGGKAKCGNGQTSGTKLAMCLWSDNGSVGMIAVYFKSVDDIKAEFATLRGQVEHHS